MKIFLAILEEASKPFLIILFESLAIKTAEKLGEHIGDIIGRKLTEKLENTNTKTDIIIERC